MARNVRSAGIELTIRAVFLEVGGEHAAAMLDQGAGIRTVREEKIGLREEKGREVGG